jgi:hypothetical protein
MWWAWGDMPATAWKLSDKPKSSDVDGFCRKSAVSAWGVRIVSWPGRENMDGMVSLGVP